MTRRQQHRKEQIQTDNDLKVSCHRFKSEFDGQEGIDDVNAKKDLTNHAWNTYYGKAVKAARYLQYRIGDDDDALVWPADEDSTYGNTTVIKHGERCYCKRRLCFQVQCKHELVVDGEYPRERYDHRWLNTQTYEEVNPNFKNKAFIVNVDPVNDLSHHQFH